MKKLFKLFMAKADAILFPYIYLNCFAVVTVEISRSIHYDPVEKAPIRVHKTKRTVEAYLPKSLKTSDPNVYSWVQLPEEYQKEVLAKLENKNFAFKIYIDAKRMFVAA